MNLGELLIGNDNDRSGCELRSVYNIHLGRKLPPARFPREGSPPKIPLMTPEPLTLTAAEKLDALRKVDIFHRWNSIGEERCCRRCGQRFTGRQINVFRGWPGEGPYRLECPTEGCPAVPIEWIALEASPEQPAPVASGPPSPVNEDPGAPGVRYPLYRPGVFGFLRVPRVFQ